ncbi:MAG: helix-turn-helix transcriptional regulator [Chthoniobacteraceae bacterium]
MDRKSKPRTGLHPRCVILGALIKAERIGRGWSQEKLAGLVGVSRQTIAAIEKGHTAPDADLLCALEDVLHRRMAELWQRAFREEAGLVPVGC